MGSERPRGCLLASSLLHIIDFFFFKKRTLSPALLPAPFHLPITPSPPTGGRAALEDGGQGRGSSARGPGRARGGGEGREAQGHPAQAHNAAQAAGLLVTWGEGTGGTRGSREVSGGDKSWGQKYRESRMGDGRQMGGSPTQAHCWGDGETPGCLPPLWCFPGGDGSGEMGAARDIKYGRSFRGGLGGKGLVH